MGVSWENRGNSKEAWDEALRDGEVWDQAKGGLRTEAFGKALLAWLPEDLRRWMSQPGRSILDWGCAKGEMTALLRAAFPKATVAGLDFAQSGIDHALATYGPPFYCADSIPGRWDVIIASNVHEHFVDYLGLIDDHLKHTRRFYVILTPRDEHLGDGEGMTPKQREKAGHAHVQRFTEDSFPQQRHSWSKRYEGVVVPGPLWPGEQLVVVYG